MYAQRVHDIGAMYGHGIGAQVEAAYDLFVRLAIDNRLTGFRAAFVFDVEHTEGKPLPEFSKTTGNPREFADKLKEFVAKQGISVEYDKSISPAEGVSFGGKIRFIPDMPPAEEFSVLAHELAHEMLHTEKTRPACPRSWWKPRPRPSLTWFPEAWGSKPTPLQLITLRST